MHHSACPRHIRMAVRLFPICLTVLLMKSLLCAESVLSTGKTVMLLLSPHHQGAHGPIRKNRMGAGK